MRRLKKVLGVIAVVLVVLVLVGAGGGYWYATKSLPQINGTVKVAGLRSQVQVVRDPMGIPHIYADNTDDLFLAQGYVQAQDRLWQMEYNRRIGHGTLSDMFGATTIKQDRFLRTMGLGRAAEADIAAMSEQDRHPLEMFSRGVNAFIESHLDNLPLEYTILGVKPEPWIPTDSAAWGKVMAYNLGGNYEAELLRAALIEKFGRDKLKDLLPPYPETGPFIVPGNEPVSELNNEPTPLKNAGSSIDQLPTPLANAGSSISQSPTNQQSIGTPDFREIAAINEWLGLHGPEIGSNNWVVDGSKSTTGKPLLANDTHLGIQMPSIWYEMGLHCAPKSDACPYDVAGFTFPGTPGIVIGHNDRIAWGVTNLGPDVQDLYIEKINPQNPNQYEFQGKWTDVQVVDEPIKVKGVVSETLHVQITQHGPIMTPVLSGVTQPVALQWTALRSRSRLFQSVMGIDRATNWNEFRAALKLWDAPSQNFVYADVDGNIGYQTPGNIPIRAQGDGTVPVPGTGEYEWTGYIPFDELPSAYNPSTHFIATANNAVVPRTFKYLIGTDVAAPYREQRITDLLRAKERLSVEDFKAIQADIYSIPEVALQKQVLPLTPEGFLQQRAMEQVKTFDGRLTPENIGGTIVEVAYQRLLRNLFADKMGKDLFETYQGANDYHRQAVLALLAQPDSVWWGSGGRDAMLKKSFAEAVDWLGSQFGDAPGDWHWSRLHTATFAHPLGSVQPLNLLFNAGPVGVPGGVFTVFATSFKSTAPYAVTSITSQRQIVDLSNWGNSLQIHTTGQSGQPLSKHYSDMVPLWRDVQYMPFYFERAALDKVREGVLVLTP